jgi:hypothetical protein
MHFALAALLASPAIAATGPSALDVAFAAARSELPIVSMVDVGACWQRADDAQADRLGLPKKFCLDRVGTSVASFSRTPFGQFSFGLIEGSPAYGLKHVGGAVRRADGGWDINVSLFDGWSKTEPRCGMLNSAFASVYFAVDTEGKPLGGPVEVRGFLMDGAAPCAKAAAAVYFTYGRL